MVTDVCHILEKFSRNYYNLIFYIWNLDRTTINDYFRQSRSNFPRIDLLSKRKKICFRRPLLILERTSKNYPVQKKVMTLQIAVSVVRNKFLKCCNSFHSPSKKKKTTQIRGKFTFFQPFCNLKRGLFFPWF